ncbi:hypothetical protein DPMN_071988 [Dreissena polymorpha]|uniref:Uncharacterized protein n=1 Tax=Dreissena polymorpha TaxID=45954 RepID=A0A9D4BWK9_DREPO|nr:hypothetical protein DPMN_071988 [Dreissena polymorpha]
MQTSTRIYALAFLLIGALLLANFGPASGALCMRGKGGRCVETTQGRHCETRRHGKCEAIGRTCRCRSLALYMARETLQPVDTHYLILAEN